MEMLRSVTALCVEKWREYGTKAKLTLKQHPQQGTILICNFSGLKCPEMTKVRPVVVVSPRLRNRGSLCTIIPLSTTDPRPVMAYHFRLHTIPPLPPPYDSEMHWAKCDMLYTMGFDRLSLPFVGKDAEHKRIYDVRVIDKADLLKIQEAMLHGLGLTDLTDYL